jgi:choline kinase
MNYIILVAGKGTRLNPLTYNYPKSLYKLGNDNKTVLKYLVDLIKAEDKTANIIVVTGFLAEKISQDVTNVRFISNPFYAVTNSIASLWFARDYLCSDCVIINGDVVVSKKLMREIITQPVKDPYILLDSSIKKDGDYNVQIHNENVIVMSKELKDYYGEYGGVTLLNSNSAILLKNEIEDMIGEGYITQWYEDALVQMIFRYNFKLGYIDIANYDWTEIDEVNDLVRAQNIYHKDNP